MENEYQILAPDYFTCVPPAGFEIDPEVTRAIQEFDAGLVPMWRLQHWRFPESRRVVRVVHHVIARYYPWRRHAAQNFHVEMPMDARHRRPNFLDHVLEYDDTLRFKRGGPGDYVPWDWALYRWCRHQYDLAAAKTWQRRHEAREARIAKLQEQHHAELAYRKKQIEPYLMRKASEISDADWQAYLEAYAKRSPDIRRKPKTMVFVGDRSPRSSRGYERVAPAQGEQHGGSKEVLEPTG